MTDFLQTDKKRVVVIGATGHIGTYLIPMLVNGGFDTIAVSRGMSEPYEKDSAWGSVSRVFLDRSDVEFNEKIRLLRPDVVIDLVKTDAKNTFKFVEVLKLEGISHYLYCSSFFAYGRAEYLPVDPDCEKKEPLDYYGKNKYRCERYLMEQHKSSGFPATVIMPGHVTGPGWEMINPWGNMSLRIFRDIAAGETIYLPNFGQEILHHVHACDVAQVFYNAITHRDNAVGQVFHAQAATQITAYGFARHIFEFLGKEPKIEFLSWDKWCEYEGSPEECKVSYYQLIRSGFYGIEKEKNLLDYKPEYSCAEAIDIALQAYIDRGLI